MITFGARIYAFLILLLTLFSGLPARAENYITDYRHGNAANKQSVVEVLGTLQGSGLLVMLDQEPVVITNSHVLQGRNKARVRIAPRQISVIATEAEEGRFSRGGFRQFSMDLELTVTKDFPYTDFAILSFPSTITKLEKDILWYYAAKNGGFCLNLPRCKKGYHYPQKHDDESKDSIVAVLGGKPTSLNIVTNKYATSYQVNTTFVPDEFTIPVYARPGVSGGGYYQQGILQGLVTKVSLIGQPLTIATSMKKIGEVLVKSQEIDKNTHWSDDGRLVIQYENQEIIFRTGPNAGGETGHGGGETGHGGDGQTSQYWNLEVPDASGENKITTWNPMYQRHSSFHINGEEAFLFRINKKLVIPTFEKYLTHKKKDVLLRNKENLAILDAERVKAPFEMNQARYFIFDRAKDLYSIERLYYWPSPFSEKEFYSNDQTSLFPGAQFILPDQNGKWHKEAKHFFPANGKKPNAEGYYENVAFSAKRTKGLLLDIIFSPIDTENEKYTIKANADLQSVRVTHANQEYLLKRTELRSPGAVLFESTDKSMKVIYAYDSENLTAVERVFIQLPNYLLEFGSKP